MATNMMSVEKVKIHGIRDERWTMRDKLNQINGLLTLKKRDKKQAIFDFENVRKSQFTEIKELKKDITTYRTILDGASKSGQQKMRNILRADRFTQLALCNKPVSKAIEHLEQSNFIKCKELNRLRFKKIQLMRVLLNLKLEVNRLENVLVCESAPANIKREQTLTNLISRTTVKQNAAHSVSFTYQSILEVLKKDARYFAPVLETLRKEIMSQCVAILKVTTMGQAVTEALADVQEEFRSYDEKLKQLMSDRSEAVNSMRQKVEYHRGLCKALVRRGESSAELTLNKVPEAVDDMDEIMNEIKKMESVMQKLRNITLVVETDDIFPRMQEQICQRIRLTNLLEHLHKKRDVWLRRRNHAELMRDQIMHNMGEFTMEYKSQKNDLNKGIDEKKAQQKRTIVEMEQLGRFMVMMRAAFFDIASILDLVKEPENFKLPAQYHWDSEDDLMNDLYYRKFEPDRKAPEENAMKLLQKIFLRSGLLMEQLANTKRMDTEQRRSFSLKPVFQVDHPERQQIDEKQLLEGETVERGVPTRADIKAQSKKIVEYFEKLPEMLALNKPKRQRRDTTKWLCVNALKQMEDA